MIRVTIATILFLAALTSVVSAAGGQQNAWQASNLNNEELAVWRTIEAWNAAFAANDVDRYFSYIDEDITVLAASNPYRVEGIGDDREEFEFGIRLGYARVALFQETAPIVRVFGDTAYATYFNRGYYGPEREGNLVYLKETNVLRKTDEGWKMIHIHVSK